MLKKLIIVCLFTALMTGCAEKPKLRILFPPPPNEPKLEFIGVYESENSFPKSALKKAAEKMTGEIKGSVFKTPMGITTGKDGQVLISDMHLRDIVVFDFNMNEVQSFTNEPTFLTPFGMATDNDGNIYVADGARRRVLVFSSTFDPLFSFGSDEVFDNPAFVTVNNELSRIYVSDGKNHNIVVFSMQGEHLFSFNTLNEERGRLYSPQGTAFSPDGELFVTDFYNARIVVFDADGKFKRTFGERGDAKNQFVTPKDVAFDSEGNLYVIDTRRSSIYTYTPEGVLLLVTGSETRSRHPLGFVQPTAIHIDKNDRIYITDGSNRRFSIWQYLSKAYLAKNPITDLQKRQLQEAIEAAKEKQIKQNSTEK